LTTGWISISCLSTWATTSNRWRRSIRTSKTSSRVAKAACGCSATYVEANLVSTADSDALITKGIIALLIRVLSGHTPQEILDADLYFIEEIGLRQHLSPTRSNGLLSMVKQIKSYALAYKAKEDMA